ncbi:hypothetical protein LTR95_008556 [Oleoguttula sp. CCFEE 5521]
MASTNTSISSSYPFTQKQVPVLDSHIAYIDTGATRNASLTAIFLHGNPTSSYIWRNIIPHVGPIVRCIAPDLIGMGKSGKPDIAYRFVDHFRYLDAFLDAVVSNGPVVIVAQDWGSALGLHWAFRHQDRIAGLALMEFIRPFLTWDDAGGVQAQEVFKRFRDAVAGRKLIIDDNVFVKVLLPGGVIRRLTGEEQEYYEAPFPTAASREPVWRWPNEIPIESHPKDVWDIAIQYHVWLLETATPKLVFWATPGAFIKPEKASEYAKKLKNVTMIDLGEGRHYLQEDHPHEIGVRLDEFIRRLLD